MTTHHMTLGIPADATPEQIKKVFLGLSKIYHPDVQVTGNANHFTLISSAYEALLGVKQEQEGRPEVIQIVVKAIRNTLLHDMNFNLSNQMGIKSMVSQAIAAEKKAGNDEIKKADTIIKRYSDLIEGMTEEGKERPSIQTAMEFDLRSLQEKVQPIRDAIRNLNDALALLENLDFGKNEAGGMLSFAINWP